MPEPRLHAYADREALAEGLAAGIAAVLAGGVSTSGRASLAVSGGSTPKRLFERLSTVALDWSAIDVVPVDERWVAPTHDRSNARLVRESLLRGPAEAARFEPWYIEGASAREAADTVGHALAGVALPFDALILGMGADGHTASFFPGGDTLGEALDPYGHRRVVAITAPNAGEPRLTLTLPVIAEARFLALHIEGAEKRAVLDAARSPGPVEEMPVRAVLTAPREAPLEIFWAP